MLDRLIASLRQLTVGQALALVGSVLGIVSVTIGIILGVRQLLPNPEPAQRSVILVVDTSRSMNQQFGPKLTKLEAVHAQIRRYVRRRPDWAIALRFSGGGCSESYVEPPVPFDENNTAEIIAAMRQHPTAQGKSDFASGLSDAVNDFDHFEAGRSAKVQLIWTFLGSGDDDCTTGVYRAIETALEGFDRPVKFDFFGLGTSSAEARRLSNLARRLRRDNHEAYINTPANPPQLRRDIEETVLREADSP